MENREMSQERAKTKKPTMPHSGPSAIGTGKVKRLDKNSTTNAKNQETLLQKL